MTNSRSPILVTGAHRTGTTWVGKMLAVGGHSTYISEPLNKWHRVGVLSTPINYWYTYICENNEVTFEKGFFEMLEYRYHFWSEIRSLRSLKDIGRMVRDFSNFGRGKFSNLRPVIKDPFAVFSAPWFSGRLGCKVVITIRHPAAFASSLKRLDWAFNFNDLLSQPLLMRDWLEPYRTEMENIKPDSDSIVVQSSLLWTMIYKVVEQYSLGQTEFYLVRHEDLSRNPVEGFRNLFAKLGFEFSIKAEKAIFKSSNSNNPGELSKKSAHSVHLNSQENLTNWKRRLNSNEISIIREIAGEVASYYYTEQEWD